MVQRWLDYDRVTTQVVNGFIATPFPPCIVLTLLDMISAEKGGSANSAKVRLLLYYAGAVGESTGYEWGWGGVTVTVT